MKSGLLLPVMLLFALSANVAPAAVVLVPENQPTIQLGIQAAQDGDVVSVWGPPPGQPPAPPWTYFENISFGGKSITVINRSYIPNQVGYDSSWDHVVIDGGHGGMVVMMNGSENSVLKGFTIQHGHTSGYGGGVNCNAGSVLKNHISYNGATSGGGVFYLRA